MKIRTKKIIAAILSICIMIACFPIFEMEVLAATGKISFNDPSVSVGDAVSVTMKIEAVDDSFIGSVEIMLSYDSSVLEFTGGDNAFGGAGSIRVANAVTSSNQKSMSFQLHFKTLQAGNVVLSVSSQEVYSYNEELMGMDRIGNSSVKIKAPVSYSSDANLSSLAVSPGALSPAFSPDTTAYSMSVGSDVNKVVVGAKESHSAAKISISGNSDLKAGANKAVVKVTAEDKQTVKTYTITINKEKGPDLPTEASSESPIESPSESESEAVEENNNKITIEGREYTFKAPEETEILSGYAADMLEYKDMQVPCLRGSTNNLILFYLVDETEKDRYFIYFPETDQFLPFQQVTSDSKSLTILPFGGDIQTIDGYVESMVQIKDQSIMAWVPQNESGRDFCLIYGMNYNGEKGIYRYDFKEETMQRYTASQTVDEEAVEAASSGDYVEVLEKYNKLVDDFNILIIAVWGLGILSLILILLLFNILFFRKKGQEGHQDDDPEEEGPKSPKPKKLSPKRPSPEPEDKKTDISKDEAKFRLKADLLEKEDMEIVDIDKEEGRFSSDEESYSGPIAEEKEIEDLSKLLNQMDYLKEEEPKKDKKEEMLEMEMDFDDDFEFLDIDDE